MIAKRLLRAACGAALLLSAAAVPALAQKTKVRWLGKATFKITSPGGEVIVIDPFVRRNPKTPTAWKDLAKMGKVDLILVSHGDGDHFSDAPALAKLTGVKVGMNADMGNVVGGLGLIPRKQLIRFNKSGPIRLDGVTITMVRAEHSSSIRHKNPAHAGYAAYAAKNLIRPRIVIRMHYGTFPPLKSTRRSSSDRSAAPTSASSRSSRATNGSFRLPYSFGCIRGGGQPPPITIVGIATATK